jgi:diacylglycerol O-acyltransferase / wax synthase
VTLSFAVLSYANSLAITVIADPDTCPDLPVLQGLLAEELTGLLPGPVT